MDFFFSLFFVCMCGTSVPLCRFIMIFYICCTRGTQRYTHITKLIIHNFNIDYFIIHWHAKKKGRISNEMLRTSSTSFTQCTVYKYMSTIASAVSIESNPNVRKIKLLLHFCVWDAMQFHFLLIELFRNEWIHSLQQIILTRISDLN